MTRTQGSCCSAERPVLQALEDLGPEFASRAAKVLSLLAEGRPVEMKEVAAALAVPEQGARSWLAQMGAEYDGHGKLVGMGLTSVPTPHALEVNGHPMYAWCAGDTLLFPALIKKSARVESTDPVSGEKISLTSTPLVIQGLQPERAVVSWPENADASDVRGSFCYQSLWFASEETARKYADANPGVNFGTPGRFLELFGPAFQIPQPRTMGSPR